MSTIRCYPVTSGELEGSTLVTWTGNFSSDADAGQSNIIQLREITNVLPGVVQDGKYKRREALADLAKAAEKKAAA